MIFNNKNKIKIFPTLNETINPSGTQFVTIGFKNFGT
jgi:hypothetical protein